MSAGELSSKIKQYKSGLIFNICFGLLDRAELCKKKNEVVFRKSFCREKWPRQKWRVSAFSSFGHFQQYYCVLCSEERKRKNGGRERLRLI